jgi:hypothetical protein
MLAKTPWTPVSMESTDFRMLGILPSTGHTQHFLPSGSGVLTKKQVKLNPCSVPGFRISVSYGYLS